MRGLADQAPRPQVIQPVASSGYKRLWPTSRMPWGLTLRNLLQDKLRFALSIVGVALAVMLILFLLGVRACGGDGKSSVQKARDFDAYGVWWLGEEFESLELSSADETTFLYGTCEPAPDAGCAPPAQVIVQEICSFPPLSFEPAAAEEAFREGAVLLHVRDGQALIRTGDSAITIFGRDDEMIWRMAEGLKSLNLEPKVGPREAMPPPMDCDSSSGAPGAAIASTSGCARDVSGSTGRSGTASRPQSRSGTTRCASTRGSTSTAPLFLRATTARGSAKPD